LLALLLLSLFRRIAVAYVLRSLKAALPSVMMASSLAILHHGKRRVKKGCTDKYG